MSWHKLSWDELSIRNWLLAKGLLFTKLLAEAEVIERESISLLVILGEVGIIIKVPFALIDAADAEETLDVGACCFVDGTCRLLTIIVTFLSNFHLSCAVRPSTDCNKD